MIRSGIPILQSFAIAAKGHSNPAARRLFMEVRTDIEGGTALADAFRRHPKYFDALYCNLIESGEMAGALDDILDRLATYKEKSLALRAKVKSALVYPAVVSVVALSVVAGLLIFIVPTFTELFKSSGQELPGPTQVVVTLSDGLVDYWWFGLVIAGFLYFLFSVLPQRMPSWAFYLDKKKRGVPVFGNLNTKSALARWSRTMATMYQAGLSIVDGLETASKAAGNLVVYKVTQDVKKEVQSGGALTNSLQARPTEFPNILVQMVSVGEETGNLDNMLNKCAEYYEQEVEAAVDALTSLLEPIMIVFLGVVVGGLMVALYLPIFQLGSAAGG
jgi:type IV pilus assembly protein PilC